MTAHLLHSSFLQFGSLRIPILGICAAIGLIAALFLSQRTARSAGILPKAAWDAGVTAIIAVFVSSRLLLIAFNLHAFLQYPLLVLALPSLTTTGFAVTAAFMLIYLRWRRTPLLPFCDCVAPCFALLWAFLSLGRVLDGTRDGMPWRARGAAIHPVELYTFIAASLICVALLNSLRTSARRGLTAGFGFILAGLTVFFVDFIRLPSNLLAASWLDPSQIIGIAMLLVGALLLVRREEKPPAEDRIETPHAV